jgi:hypothetical protein
LVLVAKRGRQNLMESTYHTSKHTGREYWIGEDGIARRLPDFTEEDCSEAEIRAEFAMSWVCGGGRPEDASAAYSLIGGAR